MPIVSEDLFAMLSAREPQLQDRMRALGFQQVIRTPSVVGRPRLFLKPCKPEVSKYVKSDAFDRKAADSLFHPFRDQTV